MEESAGIPTFAWEVGGSFGLIPDFGALVLGRIQTWPMGGERGESRRLASLALGPELRIPWALWGARGSFDLALRVGFTHAWIEPGPGRAVLEEYRGGNGPNLGLEGGIHVHGRRGFGVFANLGWTRHSVSFDYTATLIDSPSMRFAERRHFTFQDVLLTAGPFYAF